MQQFTLSEVAAMCGVNKQRLEYYAQVWQIPYVQRGRGIPALFSQSAAYECRRRLADLPKLYTITGAARELGISAQTLRKYFSPPTFQFLIRKWYTQQDVDQMRKMLPMMPGQRERLEREGYYGTEGAARYLGMHTQTFRYWRMGSRVDNPTHKIGERYYYHKADLDAIREANKDFFERRGK